MQPQHGALTTFDILLSIRIPQSLRPRPRAEPRPLQYACVFTRDRSWLRFQVLQRASLMLMLHSIVTVGSDMPCSVDEVVGEWVDALGLVVRIEPISKEARRCNASSFGQIWSPATAELVEPGRIAILGSVGTLDERCARISCAQPNLARPTSPSRALAV